MLPRITRRLRNLCRLDHADIVDDLIRIFCYFEFFDAVIEALDEFLFLRDVGGHLHELSRLNIQAHDLMQPLFVAIVKSRFTPALSSALDVLAKKWI